MELILKRAKSALAALAKKPHEKRLHQESCLNAKVAGGGERQAAKTLEGIRDDHLGRYEFAASYIPNNANVLDMACGIGYGSCILARQTDCSSILSIDISEDAIAYAKEYYASEKISYRQGDCLTTSLEKESYEAIVSFETIEHIENDQALFIRFSECLKPGGRLILSTPNQLIMPFDEDVFPFHIKHYTPTELTSLVESSGLKILEIFSQPDNTSKHMVNGWNGKFNILVCSKPSI